MPHFKDNMRNVKIYHLDLRHLIYNMNLRRLGTDFELNFVIGVTPAGMFVMAGAPHSTDGNVVPSLVSGIWTLGA